MPRDDAALVDAFLRSLAAADGDGAPLPEAAAILRRAQLRERLQAEQRRVDRTALPLALVALLGSCAVMVPLWGLPVAASVAAGLVTAVTAVSVALVGGLALIEA